MPKRPLFVHMRLILFAFPGERAIRDILKQARTVGEASNDPRINKVCNELDQLMDNLASYRARGQVAFT